MERIENRRKKGMPPVLISGFGGNPYYVGCALERQQKTPTKIFGRVLMGTFGVIVVSLLISIVSLLLN